MKWRLKSAKRATRSSRKGRSSGQGFASDKRRQRLDREFARLAPVIPPLGGKPEGRVTGSCLCGAVRYEVAGALHDVVLCHCSMCRKTHGHIGAYTAVAKSGLSVTVSRGLRWYESSATARRGFCGECGASLFWEGIERDAISIAAGTLDPPTELKTVVQIHVNSAGDYYPLAAEVPQRLD